MAMAAKICTMPAREKSKSLKHQGLGPLFEVQNAFRVAGAGISIRLQKRWQAWWI